MFLLYFILSLAIQVYKCIHATPLIRGTKRLVSVHICSVECYSAGIFDSNYGVTWNFRSEEKIKMHAYYFRDGENAVLGAIKAQLPFSEGKFQLLNS